MATSSSPQSDQTLKVEDEEELADIASTTILMVTGKRSCDAFYWIDPKLNNGWYKNQMIELYLALNPDERHGVKAE
ncbi:hypothetical protein Tco_1385120 [Tanacetum coccineum]